MCLLCSGIVLGGEMTPRPMGYVVENPAMADEQDDAQALVLHVVRDGVNLQLSEGDAVFPGDVLSTDAGSSMSVAFLDRSAIKLFPSTEVRLNANPHADGLLGGSIVQGHASVAFQTALKSSGDITMGAGTRSISTRAASS